MAESVRSPTEDQFGELLGVSVKKAFEWLVETAGPRVLAVIKRQFSSLDAEDVLQESLRRAMLYHTSYQRPSSSAAWLLQIATNVAIKWIHVQKDAAQLIKSVRVEANQRARQESDECLNERLDVLEQAICMLSKERQRVVRAWLTSQVTGEPNIAEIAGDLGKKAGNVSAQWHYARRDLKKLVQKLLDEKGLSV